eukprot:COSAG02_NODE_816_length_16859_cov_15.645764_9_plen_254_part_00
MFSASGARSSGARSAPPRHASGLAVSLRKLAEMSPPTSSQAASASADTEEHQSLTPAPSASTKDLPPRKGMGSPQSSRASLGASVQAPTESSGRSAALPGGRGEPQKTEDASSASSDRPGAETDDDLIDRVAVAAAAPEVSGGELVFPQQEYEASAPAERSVDLLLSGGLGQHYSDWAAHAGDGLQGGSRDRRQSEDNRGRVDVQQPSRTHSLSLSRVSSAVSAADSWLDGKNLLDAVTTSSRTGWKPSSSDR